MIMINNNAGAVQGFFKEHKVRDSRIRDDVGVAGKVLQSPGVTSIYTTPIIYYGCNNL